MNFYFPITTNVTYRYSSFHDASLEKVATRYQTSVDAIRKVSAALFPGEDISDGPKFKAAVKSSHDLCIPVSSDVHAFDWEIWYFGKGAKRNGVKLSSIDKVCQEADKDLRRETVPKLTGEALLKSVANAATLTTLRKLIYKDAGPLGAASMKWSAYASFEPKQLTAVLVPFPRVTSDIGVAVTPRPGAVAGSATPSVVEAAPPWLVTLYTNHLKPLDDLLAELVQVNDTCNTVKQQAAKELSVFGALTEAARMMEDSHPNPDEETAWHRGVLIGQLKNFTATAFDFMAVDVVAALELPEATQRVDLAKDVLKRLQHTDAIKGVVRILKEPDLQVALTSKLRVRLFGKGKAGKGDKVSLKGYVILLAFIAIQETAHGHAYEGALRLIDRAFLKIGTATGSGAEIAPDPDGWLDAIASLIGVGTMLVGDAPGPQALGMSLACIAATWAPALSHTAYRPGVSWTGDMLSGLVGRIAGVNDVAAFKTKLAAAARGGDTSKMGQGLTRKVEGALWQSTFWNASMGVLAAVSLASAFMELKADPSKEEHYLAVASAGSGFFAASLKTLVWFDKAGGYKEVGGAAGNVAGGVASALGIAVALATAARTYEKYGMINEVWLELASATASGIVLAGFLMGCPGTQAVGLLLGLAVMIFSYESNESSVYLGYVEAVGEDTPQRDSQLKRLMARPRNSELQRAYTELVKFVKTFDFYDEITNTPDNRAKLSALGFNADAVDKLTSYSLVADPPKPPAPTEWVRRRTDSSEGN